MNTILNVYFKNTDPNIPMKYVVIVSKYDGKWVLVHHKNRDTFEFPGGHIEDNEDCISAAKRELYEETGAKDFEIHFVSEYYVETNLYTDGGYLFFADIKLLSSLPDYEIDKVCLFELLPKVLTYQHIQPILFEKVQIWLISQSNKDEIWDLYDKHRSLTGKTHKRGEPLKSGEFHVVVHVWIMNSKNKFLITKRTPNKSYPNMWECTGGSALSGDSSLKAAIREVEEETKLKLIPQNGKCLFTIEHENDFADIWLFKQDFSIEDVVLQENETCDAKWVTKDDIKKMIEDGTFISFDYINDLWESIK